MRLRFVPKITTSPDGPREQTAAPDSGENRKSLFPPEGGRKIPSWVRVNKNTKLLPSFPFLASSVSINISEKSRPLFQQAPASIVAILHLPSAIQLFSIMPALGEAREKGVITSVPLFSRPIKRANILLGSFRRIVSYTGNPSGA